MIHILLCLITFLIIFLTLKTTKKPKGFPPGPSKWPVIGTYDVSPLSLRNDNHRVIVADMVEKYGATIGVFIGPQPFIYLHDPVMTRKLFNMEVFSGRINSPGFRLMRSPNGKANPYGILFTDGELWHGQRRFSLKTLKDLGFGRTSSESIIQEEASLLVDYFLDNCKQDFHMQSTMNIPVINVLWRMVASKRYQMDDPDSVEIMVALTTSFGNSSALRRFLSMIPGASKLLPGNLTGITKFRDLMDRLYSMFRESIKEHKETIDPSAPRDFIDFYLLEIAKNNNENFSEDQLLVIILDLFLAGAETTSTSLKWAVLFMTLNQEVQDKCREEITNVVGSRQPNLADMTKLVYCQATILEIQRLSCTVPSSLNHRVMEDTNIEGFSFPKDSIVIANFYYMMKSPAFWDEPSVFKPERFIKNGELQKDLPQMMPFSVGRRVCMGDSLARNELSIFFTSMVQRLRFTAPLHNNIPRVDQVRTGVTTIPDDYFVQIQST